MTCLHLRETDCVLHLENATRKVYNGNPPVLVGFACTGKTSVRLPLPFGWKYIDVSGYRFSSAEAYSQHVCALHDSAKLLGGKTIISVDFSPEIVDRLSVLGIPVIIVYPSFELRREYAVRMAHAGYPEFRSEEILPHWEDTIDLIECSPFEKIRLLAHQYLDSIIR